MKKLIMIFFTISLQFLLSSCYTVLKWNNQEVEENEMVNSDNNYYNEYYYPNGGETYVPGYFDSGSWWLPPAPAVASGTATGSSTSGKNDKQNSTKDRYDNNGRATFTPRYDDVVPAASSSSSSSSASSNSNSNNNTNSNNNNNQNNSSSNSGNNNSSSESHNRNSGRGR